MDEIIIERCGAVSGALLLLCDEMPRGLVGFAKHATLIGKNATQSVHLLLPETSGCSLGPGRCPAECCWLPHPAGQSSSVSSRHNDAVKQFKKMKIFIHYNLSKINQMNLFLISPKIAEKSYQLDVLIHCITVADEKIDIHNKDEASLSH